MRQGRVAPAREGRAGTGIRGSVRRAAFGIAVFVVLLVLPTLAFASDAPHVSTEETGDQCAMCHRTHTAPGVVARAQSGSWDATGSALVFALPSDTGDQVLCLTCHGIDGFGSTLDVQTDLRRSSVHSMTPSVSDYGPEAKQCSSCHDAHGSEKDPLTDLPFARLLRSFTSTGTTFYQAEEYCTTCHFDSRDEQFNRFDGLAIYQQTAHFATIPGPLSGTEVTCSICHAPHGSDIAPLIQPELYPGEPVITDTWTVDPASPRSLCYACHEAAHVTYAGNEGDEYDLSLHGASEVAVPVIAEWPRSEEATRLAGECQNCHNAMGADDGDGTVIAKLVEAEGRELCYTCHNEELAAETSGGPVEVADMESAGVFPYEPGEEGAELVVAWDPENLPLAYSAVHVHTQERGVVAGERELEGPRRYLSGSRSGATAHGDIDGFGDNELVVANPAGPELTVLRYDALAGLASATYSIEETAAYLAVGDFVGDSNGDLEVAAVSVRGDGESVLRVYRYDAGDPLDPDDDVFIRVAGPIGVGSFASGLASGSLTGGPVEDIVVTSAGDDSLWYLKESATPGVLDSDSYATLAAPRGPSVGAGMVAVANSGETVDTLSIFDATGTLDASYEATVTPGGARAWDTAIGDFLPGGDTGVAVALRSESGASAVVLFEEDVAGLALFGTVETGVRYASSSLAVGDLNGDGVAQLAVANAGVFSRTVGLSVSPSVQVLTENLAGTALEIRNPEGTRWGGGVEMAGGTPSLAVVDLGAVGRSRHPASAIPGAHDSEEATSFARHAECVDCHNPHTMTDTAPTAPDAYGLIAGTWGVDIGVASPFALKQGIDFEYELCFKCHTDGWGETEPPSRDILAELDPAANGSVHPVLADPVDPLLDRAYCIDCHGNSNANVAAGEPAGPHVSTSAPLLREPFFAARPTVAESQLCYDTCHHTYAVYHDGDPGSDFYDATSGTELHPRHVADFGLACQTCHTNHGSPNSFLIREDVDWVEAAEGGGCFTSCHADESLAGNAYSRSLLGDVEPVSITLDPLSGSLVAGYGNDLDAVLNDDTDYFVVRERNGGQPPAVLRVDLDFTGVAAVPTSFEIIGYYYGPAVVRQLTVFVRNQTDSTWVPLGSMPRVTTDYIGSAIEPLPAYSFPIPNDPDFVGAGGEMELRLDQLQGGNQNHYLYLDRVWLRY